MPSRRQRKRQRAASPEATANLPTRWEWNLADDSQGLGNVRRDLGLLRRAIRERWSETPAQRQAVVNAVGAILEHSLTQPRQLPALLLLTACRAVLEMELQNQREEHAAISGGRSISGTLPTRTPFKLRPTKINWFREVPGVRASSLTILINH